MPPITSARWYGGHAAVPSVRSFSSSQRISDAGFSNAFVSWNSRLLFAEPPPFAMKSSLYDVAVDRFDLDLGRQVRAGVLLLEHGERRHLRVAEVVLGVGAEDAARDRFAVAAAGEHELALLALHDRGAGVLARRQHAAGRDARVLQQLDRDEHVVGRRLGIVEDRRELREVARAQQVRDVEHRLAA